MPARGQPSRRPPYFSGWSVIIFPICTLHFSKFGYLRDPDTVLRELHSSVLIEPLVVPFGPLKACGLPPHLPHRNSTCVRLVVGNLQRLQQHAIISMIAGIAAGAILGHPSSLAICVDACCGSRSEIKPCPGEHAIDGLCIVIVVRDRVWCGSMAFLISAYSWASVQNVLGCNFAP